MKTIISVITVLLGIVTVGIIGSVVVAETSDTRKDAKAYRANIIAQHSEA